MKVELRSPHDFGQIVGFSYRIYLRNFWTLFAVALITVPLPMLEAVIGSRIDAGNPAQLLVGLIMLANVFVAVVATGSLIHAVNQIASGVAVEAGSALDAGLARFTSLISSNLLAGILTLLSLIFFPYFLVRWLFVPQAVMLEDKRNWAALDASSSIVKGAWWRTAGIALVVVLIGLGPSILASPAARLPVLPATTIVTLAAALALPFIITAQTLLYFDLKARKQTHVSVD